VMFDTYPKGALTKVYRLIALTLFAIGVQSLATAAVPEIDPASAGSAIALLAGVAVLIRGRRK